MPKRKNKNDPAAGSIPLSSAAFAVSKMMVEENGTSTLNIMDVCHWAHTILEACRRRAEAEDSKAIVQDLTALEVHLASFIAVNALENPNGLEVSAKRGPIPLDPDENSVLSSH